MWIITWCCKKAVQKYSFFLKYQRVTSLKVNINLNFVFQLVLFSFFGKRFLFSFYICLFIQAADIIIQDVYKRQLLKFCVQLLGCSSICGKGNFSFIRVLITLLYYLFWISDKTLNGCKSEKWNDCGSIILFNINFFSSNW